MREIFVESELREFRCPPGFCGGAGDVSVGEPLQGGRTRTRPLFMHRLLAPEELTQEALFVYRNWKGRRCYPDPDRPQAPLWWVVDGEPERFVIVSGERQKARLEQLPADVASGPASHGFQQWLARVTSHDGIEIPDFLPPLPSRGSVAFTPVAAAAAPAGAVAASAAVALAVRPDPFRQSVDAVLADLRAIAREPVHPRPTVALRSEPFARPTWTEVAELAETASLASWSDEALAEGPIPLPACPQLVSCDFVPPAPIQRPALAPADGCAPSGENRIPGRAFAVAAATLTLLAMLGFWLSHR